MNHSMNTNNFFSIVDGRTRIIGLFDGHGEQGHYVSNAAMGIMLDYIRNRNEVFRSKIMDSSSEEDILHEIKKAFKYTQQVLRQDYEFMAQKRKMEAEKVKMKEAERKQKEKERVLNELLGGAKLFKKFNDSDFNVPEKFFKQIHIQDQYIDESPEISGYSLSERGDIQGIYNDNPVKS